MKRSIPTPREITVVSPENMRSSQGAAAKNAKLTKAVTPKVSPRQTRTLLRSRSYFWAPKF